MTGKKLVTAVALVLMITSLSSGARAQDIGADVLAGQTYICLFYTPLDIISTNITFNERGRLVISSFGGYGLYYPVNQLFTGAYWSPTATIGTTQGSVIIALAGTTIEPFILGTGLVIINYEQTVPLLFTGLQTGSVTVEQ